MSMQAQTLDQKYKNIFQIMLQGDIQIEKLKKNVVAIVGKTKVGKSTTTNWICGIPMIGKVKFGKHFYQNKGQFATKTSNSYASETLVPNIKQIHQNISIVDMPGYDDSRIYLGVLGVTHMLKAVFEQSTNLKFILVIENQEIQAIQGDRICKSFFNFIDMFDFKSISNKAKKTIFDSVSVVINRTTQKQKSIINLIKGVIENIKSFKYDKKEQIIEMLNYLLKECKFAFFPMSQKDVMSPECNLIESLEKTNKWHYLNLNKLKRQQNKQIINLPFSKLYQKLQQSEKDKFKQQIDQRIKFYKVSQTLFQQIFSTPQQIDQNSHIENWYQRNIKYDRSQKYLKDQILSNFNFYEQNQYEIPEQYIVRYTGLKQEMICLQPIGLQLIKLLEQISKETNEVQYKKHDGQSNSESINRVQKQMKQMLYKVKKLFCKINIKSSSFAFIYLRGFQQFRMLFQIDPSLISAGPKQITDTIKGYFTYNINDIKAKFILNLTDQYLSRQVTNQLLKALIQECQKLAEISELIKKKSLKAKQIKLQKKYADILLKDNHFKKAMMHYLKVEQNIQKLQEMVQRHQFLTFVDDIPNLRIKNYSQIGYCLQRLQEIQKAVQIFMAINYVTSSIRCYQLLIKIQGPEKVQKMIEFSNYCNKVRKESTAQQILENARQCCTSSQQLLKVDNLLRTLYSKSVQNQQYPQYSQVLIKELIRKLRQFTNQRGWD